ncbi:uncharacterized protein LOC143898011 [Temnothorax americanus]|uniref:uncharacterized protein LOC143898011 n=1 Tax=Temnothorax americanus TaxID=1964332 RepID=UPI004068F4C1
MADDFVKNLLKQWNLGFLISNFEQDRGIYYSSVQSKGPGFPVNISGVLYNHYCHCRKLLKTAGLLTKNDSNKNKRNNLIESENNTEENDSIEKTLEWLQTNTTGTLEEHLEKWESIFAARSLLDDMSIGSSNYYRKWSINSLLVNAI